MANDPFSANAKSLRIDVQAGATASDDLLVSAGIVATPKQMQQRRTHQATGQ